MHTKIRKILPNKDEIGFIMKTWGREEYKNQPQAFPERLFYPEFGKIIVKLAQRAECMVACNPEDINQIQGFAIGKPEPTLGVFVLHFVYVRPEFRRLGLCREMCSALGYVPEQELVASHWSKDASKIDRKGRPIIYNKFIAYGV